MKHKQICDQLGGKIWNKIDRQVRSKIWWRVRNPLREYLMDKIGWESWCHVYFELKEIANEET